MTLEKLVFGSVSFKEGEEYRRFQYRFANVLILFSVIVTGVFILAADMGMANLHPYYLWGGTVYCLVFAGAFLALRRWPAKLPYLAAVCMTMSFVLEAIAFLYNAQDEMRIIWFALSIPATFLIVGTRAGLLLMGVSVIFVTVANGQLAAPYSPSAIVTVVVAILYISAFFWAFQGKSVSFHHAMVEANNKLAVMASCDPLTGLYNARAYYALCENAISQAQRSNQPVVMLFIDLDHFKSINDQYGHEAGDIVLKEVAAALRSGVRTSDAVGRIGGEEFCVLLPGTDLDGGKMLAEKLRMDVEYLMPDIGSQCLRVTASIGVAGGHAQVQSFVEIQKQADQAMYQAKRAGRNRVTCIDEIGKTCL